MEEEEARLEELLPKRWKVLDAVVVVVLLLRLLWLLWFLDGDELLLVVCVLCGQDAREAEEKKSWKL